MASRSTARARLPVRRVGEHVLRLRDGSLRAVMECAAVTAVPAHVLGALSALGHPVQLVLRARRAEQTDERAWLRLRASHAVLMSSLTGQSALVRRQFVVVPWDVQEGGQGTDALEARVQDVCQRLHGADVETIRLAGAELDTITAADIAHEGRCDVHMGGRLARTLILTRLPETLAGELLDGLACDHDLSLHALPASRPGHVELAVYATLWADDRGALDAATEYAEARLAARGIHARRPYLLAEPALLSALPLCLELVEAARVVPAIRGARAGDRSLLYGADPGTRQPLRLDRFGLANAAALVVGRSEDRRRVLSLELLRARLAGIDVHVVDGTGALASAIAGLDGHVVSPTGFDAFTVSNQGLEARLRTLLALIQLVAGDLTPELQALVEDALAYVFAAHGYTRGRELDDCEPPTLAEIVVALERRPAGAPGDVRALVHRLERFGAGPGQRLLGRRPTSPNLGRLSVHDLACLPHEERPPAALLCLDRLCRQITSGRHSLLVLDGVDELLTGVAGQVMAALQTASAPEVGRTLATNDLATVLCGPLREAALASGLKVLLRQEPRAAEQLGDVLRLTPAEQSWLHRAAPDEGLLVTQDRRLAFRAVASEEEERLISGGVTQ